MVLFVKQLLTQDVLYQVNLAFFSIVGNGMIAVPVNNIADCQSFHDLDQFRSHIVGTGKDQNRNNRDPSIYLMQGLKSKFSQILWKSRFNILVSFPSHLKKLRSLLRF